MSTETSSSKVSFIEILAILIFIVGIVFIFVSKDGNTDKERELRNAVRFQDISLLADSLWKLSISSTEYTARLAMYPKDIPCSESDISVQDFADLLIPTYFETLPLDPAGESYRVAFDTSGYMSVCSLWGEEEDGTLRVISITR